MQWITDLNKMLERFGLQHQNDIMEFLESPNGKSLKKLISLELKKTAALKDNIKHINQVNRIKHILSALLILLKIRNNEKKRHLNELINIAIDEELETEQELTNQEIQHSHEILEHDQQLFDAAIKAAFEHEQYLENEWSDAIDIASDIEQDIKKIDAARVDLETKYNIYNDKLKDLDELFEVQNIDLADIEKKINVLEQELHENVDKISDYLMADDEVNARQLLHVNNGLNLILSAYKIIENKIASTKIVEYEDKFYLIPKDKDIKNLSAEEKNKANIDYSNLTNELKDIKLTVQKNEQNERNFLTQRQTDVHIKNQNHQQHVLKLANQLVEIHAARANMLAQNPTLIPLSELPNTNHTPDPTPTPTPTMKKQCLIDSYKKIVNSWPNGVSREKLDKFKNNLSHLPQTQQFQKVVNCIIPGQPLSPAQLSMLGQAIDRMGFNSPLLDKQNEIIKEGSKEDLTPTIEEPIFNPTPKPMPH